MMVPKTVFLFPCDTVSHYDEFVFILNINPGISIMRIFAAACLTILSFSLVAEASKIVLVAGSGKNPPPALATEVQLKGPFGVDWNSSGDFYIIEIAGHRVMKVDAKNNLTLVGGTGEKGSSGDDANAQNAKFNGMHSVIIGKDDAIYVADTWNNRVRKIDSKTNIITAFAGTGDKAFSGDNGPATKAVFTGVFCIAFDAAKKNLIITDLENRRIRSVNLETNIVTTLAGNGKGGVPKNNSKAVDAPLVDPRAACMDTQGNLYILERGGHALRLVGKDGMIKTVVGTGKAGSKGVGGPALQTELNGPKHLCVDNDGTVLIADTENHRVLRYDPKSETTSLVAGTGKKGTSGIDGPPEKVELFQPHGVQISPKGEIYITDSGNNRILKIVK